MLINTLTKQFLGALAAITLLIPPLAVQAANPALQLDIDDNTIQVSTFYNGTSLEVSGTVEGNADVILQVSGPKHDVHLKEKGKVAGFLWMNKTDVSLENTPAVYMLYTPGGSPEKFVRPEFGVGYKALLQDMTIEPASEDKSFIFGEYVKLMEESGVYAINNGAVTYGTSSDTGKTFRVTLNIPSKMSAGNYTVEAISIRNGAVLDRTTEKLTLELTGFPRLLSDLAFESPLIFGFMAVFIALGTGLIIGVLFRGGGGAH